jgi:2-keto-4-pentenoate hydratase
MRKMDDLGAARFLWDAWSSGVTIDALPDGLRPRDAVEGMAVQARLEELAGPAFGWKIGATTAAGQAAAGVDRAFPGRMFTRFRHAEGKIIPTDSSMAVVEPEFAFRLGTDLDPDVEHTLDAVLDAVDTMFLALEMPDSRFSDFTSVGYACLLADSALCGRFVGGCEVPGWRDLDLAAQPVILRLDGVEFARGTGAEVMGDPRLALHWLALELPRLGRRLRAGEVVTTGTATKPAPVTPGAHVFADFGDLGTIEGRFGHVS